MMTTQRAVRRTVQARPKWGAIVAFVVLLAVFGVVGVSVYVGWSLSHAPPRPVDSDPSQVGLVYEDVEFLSAVDGIRLRGWFLPAEDSDATVIMAHGFRSNRLQPSVPALQLAASFVESGLNVLMFDFRNSGESDGTVTTLGYHEVKDVVGAVTWLKEKHPAAAERIGVIGFSMGAVTAALAAAQDERIEAVVLDSPFADLKPYLQQNMPFWTGLPNVPFTWTILALLPPLIGLDMAAVSPLQVMPDLTQPTLIIHTTDDDAIPVSNSEQLAAAGHPERTELWVVPGAKHVGAREVAPAAYDERVVSFFRTALGFATDEVDAQDVASQFGM